MKLHLFIHSSIISQIQQKTVTKVCAKVLMQKVLKEYQSLNLSQVNNKYLITTRHGNICFVSGESRCSSLKRSRVVKNKTGVS